MPSRADMFVEPDEDQRNETPPVGDELTLLTGFLRWQRQTLELKCSGLTPEQLATRAVEPSTMSLLGLVRHMADVERNWFRRTMSQLDARPLYWAKGDPDGDFDNVTATAEAVDQAFTSWRREVEFAERFVEEAESLEVTGSNRWMDSVSLRWVLIHMIEEYARHLGHADLLRERIDGRLGQ